MATAPSSPYADPEYRRLRPIVLQRDPFCPGYPVGIHDGAPVPTTVVDHRIPLARGGRHTLENLHGMCGDCNGRKALDDRVRTWRDG
jgi:5-methylcytosine-specific restriction endonuclease McrA